jgi:hypothetical protein
MGSANLKTQQHRYSIDPDDNPENAMKTEFVAEIRVWLSEALNTAEQQSSSSCKGVIFARAVINNETGRASTLRF